MYINIHLLTYMLKHSDNIDFTKYNKDTLIMCCKILLNEYKKLDILYNLELTLKK